MSTKIYEAYLIEAIPSTGKPMSMYEMKLWCRRLRKRISRMSENIVSNILARMIQHNLDTIALGIFPGTAKNKRDWIAMPKTTAEYDFVQRIKKIEVTGEKDPYIDFLCSISILPLRDKTLILPFYVCKEYRGVFSKTKGLIPYGYWDNVDPEEGVSEKSWEQRRYDWDLALPDSDSRPIANGFTFELVDKSIVTNRDPIDILECMDSYESRVTHWSRHLAVQERIGRQSKKKGMESKTSKISKYMSLFKEASKWVKEDTSGRKALIRKRSQVIAKLKPTYTIEDL